MPVELNALHQSVLSDSPVYFSSPFVPLWWVLFVATLLGKFGLKVTYDQCLTCKILVLTWSILCVDTHIRVKEYSIITLPRIGENVILTKKLKIEFKKELERFSDLAVCGVWRCVGLCLLWGLRIGYVVMIWNTLSAVTFEPFKQSTSLYTFFKWNESKNPFLEKMAKKQLFGSKISRTG